uniref:Ovule protein n=1 Tax=Heterorhabditis bacteriophora TaxID=37862 RepID=A0A1I7X5N4_HETBA
MFSGYCPQRFGREPQQAECYPQQGMFRSGIINQYSTSFFSFLLNLKWLFSDIPHFPFNYHKSHLLCLCAVNGLVRMGKDVDCYLVHLLTFQTIFLNTMLA